MIRVAPSAPSRRNPQFREGRSAERDEDVGAQAGGSLPPLTLEPDRRAEDEGRGQHKKRVHERTGERRRQGARKRDDHGASPRKRRSHGIDRQDESRVGIEARAPIPHAKLRERDG